MNFPVRRLEEEIRAIAALGFDFLELAMDPPGAQVADLMQRSARLRELLASCGLDLVCHLPTFVSTADLSPRIREASLRESLDGLEVASSLGAHRVVVHPSFFMGLGSYVREASEGLAMASLAELVHRGRELGLQICLENMFSAAGWLATAEDFAPIMEAFPELGITLDIGHAHILGGSDCALGFIHRYPTRIRHLHVSDNWGRHDDHLPLGAGNVRMRPIISELRRISYDGWVTFEIFSPDRDYLRISREKFLKLWDVPSTS